MISLAKVIEKIDCETRCREWLKVSFMVVIMIAFVAYLSRMA